MPTWLTIGAALRTTIPARLWGDVTSTTPLIGSDCITVSEASDVPGGSPPAGSPGLPTGPRSRTGDRPADDWPAPDHGLVFALKQQVDRHHPDACARRSVGRRATGLEPDLAPFGKNILGMLGPVMSRAQHAHLIPAVSSATASSPATNDLPTPPLPLITAMMCLTWLSSSAVLFLLRPRAVDPVPARSSRLAQCQRPGRRPGPGPPAGRLL